MKVWAIANQKGGVGKTTTAISLAGWLALRGQRTLMVDMDPHGSMTTYFGYDPDSLDKSVYHLFQQASRKEPFATPKLIQHLRFDNLNLLPATTAIATLDRQLGAQEGMGLVLARALKQVAADYDHVLIDCPPMLGVLMINALAACERLLIPVQTEFLALKGLERMVGTINMINRARKDPLDYLIVPTLYDRRTRASLESLRALRMKYPQESLSKVVIPVDTKFREASRRGEPLPILNQQARGAAAYELLLDNLLSGGSGWQAAPAESMAQ